MRFPLRCFEGKLIYEISEFAWGSSEIVRCLTSSVLSWICPRSNVTRVGLCQVQMRRALKFCLFAWLEDVSQGQICASKNYKYLTNAHFVMRILMLFLFEMEHFSFLELLVLVRLDSKCSSRNSSRFESSNLRRTKSHSYGTSSTVQ